ncbi:MAG: decaprenylphospho-beta-D-erythro-pentofuranosid-2-ulose 2-reductase [Acidimicrobiia bacterium]
MENALGAAQSVLVLGGGSEIGLATVRRLIAGGCRTVVLAARAPEALAGTAEELRGAGAAVVDVVPFDAALTAVHGQVVDDVFGRHGDFDVVMLAFGVLGSQADYDADPEAAADAVRVNYVGLVSAGLHVARQLRRQGHGTLVVLSSVAGERARKANFVYGSAKAGIDAFAQGLGDALVGSGARVLVVRPGFVKGRMTEGLTPAPLATTPDAVAGAVVQALATGEELVWVPSGLRWLMSVLRHLPRPLWRRVSANR